MLFLISYFQTDLQNDSWIVKSDPAAPSLPNVLAKLTNNDATSDYHIPDNAG